MSDNHDIYAYTPLKYEVSPVHGFSLYLSTTKLRSFSRCRGDNVRPMNLLTPIDSENSHVV